MSKAKTAEEGYKKGTWGCGTGILVLIIALFWRVLLT